MLNSLKLLINRLRPKSDIDDFSTAQVCESTAEIKPCAETIKEKSSEQTNSAGTEGEKTHGAQPLPASNPFDEEALRKKISNELRSSDVSARQRDREFMNKWFQRSELTNSGNFNLVELQRRLEELGERDIEFIPQLPMQEDVMMAFSKPEVDLFEEEKISLSGVFLKVDPHEDFDEFYSVPLLPMYSAEETPLFMPASHDNVLQDFETDVDLHAQTAPVTPCLNGLIQELAVDESIVEEALEELNASMSAAALPEPIPAFIKCAVLIEDRPVRKIDPSALFEEWKREPDSTDSHTEVESIPLAPDTPPQRREVSKVKLVAQHRSSSKYWSESDRLSRFGRQKTSASCASTRVHALHQIA